MTRSPAPPARFLAVDVRFDAARPVDRRAAVLRLRVAALVDRRAAVLRLRLVVPLLVVAILSSWLRNLLGREH